MAKGTMARTVARFSRWLRGHGLLVALVVMLAALALRVYRIDFESIWMDENAQAEFARSSHIIEGAAKQHQPPIDYLLESLFLEIFGVNEHGARLHAALWGSLAAALFFLWMKMVFRHPAAILLSTLLFVIEPHLVRYSQEGRPIACGVFFAVLYLFVSWGFLLDRFRRTPYPKIAARLLLVNVCFLLSVGFQPLPWMAASCLSLSPGLLFRRFRMRILITWGIAVLSFFIALPMLLMAVEEGARYVGEASLIERLRALGGGLGSLTGDTWLEKYRSLLLGYVWLLGLVGIPALIGVVADLSKGRRRSPSFVTLYLFGFWLLFPAIFDWVFYSQITYVMRVRYYLTFAPLLVAGVGAMIDHFARTLSLWASSRSRALFHGWWLLAFLAAGTGLVSGGAELQRMYRTRENAQWRTLYDIFKEQGSRRDRAYIMNLVDVDKWAPFFHARRFYYTKEERTVRLRPVDRLISDFEKKRVRGDLYLVVAYGADKVAPLDLNEADRFWRREYVRLCVMKLERGGDQKERLVDLFETLATSLPWDESNFKVIEILAWLSIQEGDLDAASDWIEVLEGMDVRGRLDGKVIQPLLYEVEYAEDERERLAGGDDDDEEDEDEGGTPDLLYDNVEQEL